MRDLIAAEFLILLPIAWIVVCLTMSRLSGWALLAKHYRARQRIVGESAAMRSGRLGVIQYHSCLRFRINDDGLWIAVAWPLRLGHPPLWIPWDQMHDVAAESRLYSHRVKVAIGHPTLVRAALPGWVRYRMPDHLRR